MNSEAKKLLSEAMRLPSTEREALAGELFDSLESDDPDAEKAWQAEVERRMAELDRGEVTPIPWAEARQLIFGESDDPAQD